MDESKKQAFVIEAANDVSFNTVIYQDPFFRYIVENVWPVYWDRTPERESLDSMEVLSRYLKSKGFDKEKHFLPVEKLKSLKRIFSLATNTVPVLIEPQPLSDLLVKTEYQAYFVRHDNDSYFAQPTEKLKAALNKSLTAKKSTSNNIHFRIVGNKLWACYSHIIGHAFICELS